MCNKTFENLSFCVVYTTFVGMIVKPEAMKQKKEKSDRKAGQAQGRGLWERLSDNADYCMRRVWADPSKSWKVRAIKVVNLSVRSFMDRDLQMRAGSLTYNTVLALVPALAMIFAIARGFGFQNLLQGQLMNYFPAQRQALSQALSYVENYLSQTSQGAFIGIGLVVLLWTLLSLMNNVEDAFNGVWGITRGRSMVRKFTDYTALMLLLPVLMVCTTGIEVLMSDTVQQVLADDFLSPVARMVLRFVPWLITWLVFTAAFAIIPNTRVSLSSALWSGLMCSVAFHLLQWLFVTGQVYVSKYNAIYGSFAFLPLLLVWLQLTWLITLSGVALTYAGQNYYNFAHSEQAAGISTRYADELALGILAMAAQRFCERKPPLTSNELMADIDLPSVLADKLLDRLIRAGLLTPAGDSDTRAFVPAYDVAQLTVSDALDALSQLGNSDFISAADTRFAKLRKHLRQMRVAQLQQGGDMLVRDLL